MEYSKLFNYLNIQKMYYRKKFIYINNDMTFLHIIIYCIIYIINIMQ